MQYTKNDTHLLPYFSLSTFGENSYMSTEKNKLGYHKSCKNYTGNIKK
jgi:hypothetical protein